MTARAELVMQPRGDLRGRTLNARATRGTREDHLTPGARNEVERPALVPAGRARQLPGRALAQGASGPIGYQFGGMARVINDLQAHPSGVVTITCSTDSAAATEMADAARATITAAASRNAPTHLIPARRHLGMVKLPA